VPWPILRLTTACQHSLMMLGFTHAEFIVGTPAAVDGKGLVRPNSMQQPYVRTEATDWLGGVSWNSCMLWPVPGARSEV
jgi:hypothetical protein